MNPTSTKLPALTYISGLNGIRALAVLLVISSHWPTNLLSWKLGWIGVNIFFVLSGYLITRILLAQKQKKLKDYLLEFYYKRSIRIFPAYYLFLAVFFLMIFLVTFLWPELKNNEPWEEGYRAIRADMPFLLTYTYNLKLNLRYFFSYVDSSNQFFGHLWSLAVEQQFYLVFPFVVYFSSRRLLKIILCTLLILCPLIRLWAALFGIHLVKDLYWLGELFYTNTFLQADALAAGAALAVFKFNITRTRLLFFITTAIWLFVGLMVFYYLRKSGYFLVEGKSFGYNFPGFWFEGPTPYFLLNIRASYQYSLVNLLAVTLILPALLQKPLLPSFFTHPFVDYLGKISYGIYMLHNPLMAIMLFLLEPLGGRLYLTVNPISQIHIFIFYIVTVVMLAHLSYQYYEKRFLSLKSSPLPFSSSRL